MKNHANFLKVGDTIFEYFKDCIDILVDTWEVIEVKRKVCVAKNKKGTLQEFRAEINNGEIQTNSIYLNSKRSFFIKTEKLEAINKLCRLVFNLKANVNNLNLADINNLIQALSTPKV